MNRSILRQTLSIVALAAAHGSAALAAPPTLINGGGATAPQFAYAAEEALYNAANTVTNFGTYYGVASGAAQTGFINNDPTQFGPGLTFAVDYAVSEAVLAASQVSPWSTSTVGQAAAGNLIQIPAAGTSVAIPVVNSAVTANGGSPGGLSLTDTQLCEIFSGKITDWSQVSGALTGGAITVVYRSDSGGTSFNLSNHLSKVCTAANSNFLAGFGPTTTFANLFAGGIPPANFHPVKGNLGVANYLSSLGGTTVTSAIGYVPGDYTSVDPNSDVKLANNQNSALFAAAIVNGRKAYLPTTTNIALALSSPGSGAINPSPPANATDGADPLKWVPQVPVALKGYPISAYNVFLLPQCYANASIAAGVRSFLKLHYTNASYTAIQTRNGLVRIANGPSGKFLKAVQADILANTNHWNVDIQDAAACASKTGR